MRSTFKLTLNDAKVFKRFGRHPERGVRLPFLPPVKAEAGMRWVQFSKKYKPNPIEVSPTITLTKVKGNWIISCPKHHFGIVSEWLRDNMM